MKRIFIGLCLVVVSLNVSAKPTSPQRAACKAKVETALSVAAKALGMGNGVKHVGGAEITGVKTLANGKIVHIYGGGILAADDSEGYISGSGAVTEVIFNSTDCDISKMEITTGADF